MSMVRARISAMPNAVARVKVRFKFGVRIRVRRRARLYMFG